MKLSKKAQTELLEVYESWWKSYLNGDIHTYDKYLDDDYRFVGATDGEEFLNKQETTNFFNQTADQLAGKSELRNLKRTLEPLNDLISITDLADAYILSKNEWVFYSPFRFTSLLRKSKDGWKFVYQHFSTPDSKTEEGKTIANEKITKENLQLRETVKRLMLDLEAKARDLEIEAALEKVRSRMLRMHKSRDLEKTTTVMYQQLDALKVVPEGAMVYIVIADTNTDTAIQWLVSDGTLMIPPEGAFRTPMTEDPRLIKTYEAWKRQDPLLIRDLSGDELEDFKKYIKSLPSFQEAQSDIDKWPERVVWSEASFSNGTLGYIYTEPLPDETLEILVRFSKVIDLTYTRFLDLKKSEELTREALIEVALERIRSRSMAMLSSEELLDVIHLISEQINQLNIRFDAICFGINNPQGTSKFWLAMPGQSSAQFFQVPYINNPIPNRVIEAQKENVAFFSDIASTEENRRWIEHLIEHTALKDLPEKIKTYVLNSPGYARSSFILKNINLFIGNYKAIPLSKEDNEICKRFSQVFEQSYTRFLDLQKAESQVREAHIEAALERVRSRSMAMHQSEELKEVIKIVYQQLIQLKINLDHSGFVVDYTPKGDWNFWIADKQDIPSKISHPYFKSVWGNQFNDAKEKGEDFFATNLNFEEKNKFYNELLSFIPELPKVSKDFYLSCTGLAASTVLFDNVGLYIENFEGIPYTDEENNTLMRFGKVFQQTYIRFLDLQKAEIQAREAQIENALEKVRSRSLAMHQSDEIHEIVNIVFEQFLLLDVQMDSANFNIFSNNSKDMDVWMATPKGGTYSHKIHIPYFDISPSKDLMDAIDGGVGFMEIHCSKEKKDKWFEYMYQHTDFGLIPQERKQFIKDSECWTLSTAFSKYSAIQINSYSRSSFSERENNILKRFAKSFEQAYVRFLDLQKAEAQARESEIELALERVRARTMAMQHSDELSETSFLLDSQVRGLGVKTWGCAFNIYGKTESTEWFGNEAGVLPKYTVPRKGIFKKYYDNGQKGEEFIVDEFKGKACIDHYEFMSTLPIIGDILRQLIERNGSYPTYQIDHVVYYKYGYLLFITIEHVPEAYDIFKRFTKVFEQTYTRFLDLQKAEEQAREAQIESALEKVRSRSLAMHKPDELQEVVAVVAEKLQELGVIFDAGGVILCTYFPDNKDVVHWIAAPDFSYSGNYLVPYFDNPIFNDAWDSKIRGDAYFSKEFPVEVKNNFFSHCFEHSDYKNFPDEFKQHALQAEKHHLSAAWSKNSAIIIPSLTGVVPSESDAEIMKRFGKVFEQAYIRFLDLQKAEAQAREAQIEAALEKVRSRTLAMQKSEELTDVATVLFQQAKLLGIPQWTCGFSIWEMGDEEFTFYPGSPDGDIMPACTVPLNEHPVFKRFDTSRRRGDELYIYEKKGKEQEDHYQYMLAHPGGLGDMMQKMLDSGLEFPAFQIDHLANFSHGNLIFITYEHFPEMHDVFKRFAKVFEQTYTRFLDLQKAEEQTREAKIETALEKVRSKTMAMHESQQLNEVIGTVFEQLEQFDLLIDGAQINIFDDTQDSNVWISIPGKTYAQRMHIPYFEHDYLRDFWKQKQEGKTFITYRTERKNKNILFKHWFKHSDLKMASAKRKKFILDSVGLATSTAIVKNASLIMYNFSAIPYSDKENDILKRFSQVFEQTYTRFLDLQNAEMQAREAQIENALEKVRSRSLAMHHSDELQEVINTIYGRLIELGIKLDSVNFTIFSEESKDFTLWTGVDRNIYRHSQHMPYIDFGLTKDFWVAIEDGRDFFAKQYSFEEKNKWWRKAFEVSDLKQDMPEYRKQLILEAEGYSVALAIGKFSCVQLNRYSTELFNEQDQNVTKRFAKVFEQAYIRFMDLQKAEAQVREAQIEAALERIRSRSMAMHKSDELQEIITVVFEQLFKLGIKTDTAHIHILDDSKDIKAWIATADNTYSALVNIPYFDNPVFKKIWESIKKKNEILIEFVYKKKEKNQFFKHLFLHSDLKHIPEERKKLVLEGSGYSITTVAFDYTSLLISKYVNEPYTREDHQIFIRFGRVFEQTYTRFLDLQKAEEQAREAQIEASLERVRAKAMALHTSKDLISTASVVFDELGKLGITTMRSGISIQNRENRINQLYAATNSNEGSKLSLVGNALLDDHPVLSKIYDQWILGKDYFPKLTGNLLKTYYELIAPAYTVPKEHSETEQYGYFISFSHGTFYGWSKTPIEANRRQILKRFASVVDLTFRRYFDLQKAEAQVREAQIETALEKIRSRSLAMHKSDELHEVINILFEQLIVLGLEMDSTNFIIFSGNSRNMDVYMATPIEGTYPNRIHIPYFDISPSKDIMDARDAGVGFKEIYFSKEKKDEWFQHLLQHTDFGLIPDERKQVIKNSKCYTSSIAMSKYSAVQINSYSRSSFSERENDILKRFAKSFEQAYVRFLDLQKSEEQAREAQIEASLERVRSRSMGMQKSSELNDVIQVIYDQLIHLDFNIDGAGFATDFRDSDDWNLWTADRINPIPYKIHIPYFDHPLSNAIIEAKNNNLELLVIELTHDEKNVLYEEMFKYVTAPEEVQNAIYSSPGYTMSKVFFESVDLFIYNFSGFPHTIEENDTLLRFGKVFEQTYVRFNDLKKAETQAKEALKQSSLDRLRAKIASMRTATDLEQIIPSIWNELDMLGVPFIRCGVFIMNEEKQSISTYLSAPNGKALAAFELDYETTEIAKNAVLNWRKRKIYQKTWSKKEFVAFMTALIERDLVKDPLAYQGAETPPENLYLNFAPFKQGMLYVGNIEPLSNDQLDLVQTLAKAFSIAYARYEDFNQLEEAKKSIENTLAELKSTQSQLIQSEKMASLGELTAGIAHEIQNPLNFVNNFSEVSEEMMEELEEEIENNSKDGIAEIITDIKQNLLKINHHGKRASSIVKGMLDHSRTSDGVKVLTDINVLADEYLRLSFHGLRAKDKSFNAEFKTDFEENLPKINIIQQDIGRVLLNLINNAFYAVNGVDNPSVTVSTNIIPLQGGVRGGSQSIQISVQDNGPGIPEKIKEKIFQPFFTTKPTGKGTGLGLSLSYDIVKAHGGALKVKSTEGKGTEFVISLPWTPIEKNS